MQFGASYGIPLGLGSHLDMGAKIIQLLEVTWGPNEIMDFKVFCKLTNTPEVGEGGQKSQVT